jgi:RND family efflux transporter MFP subunit
MLADSANFNASLSYFTSIQDLNNYLLITSPFNGVVTVRNMNLGDIVGTNSSRPIFEVENTTVLRVRVAVPEAYTGNELVSKIVTYTVSAYPDISFTARFARKAGGIDINTRTEIWEFETDNTDRRLKGGMYAEIKLKFERSKPTVFIPRSALVTTLEKSFVILVRNETTDWIDVTRGITIGDRLEIFGNLKDGDILLANANEEIKPGTRIKFRIPENKPR